MRASLLLLPLALGCGPYIKGTWAENAPARAASYVTWNEFDGSGWGGDNSPTGEAVWGWFAAPQDDFSTNWVLPAPVGCSDNEVDLLDWTDRLVDLPAGTSVISSTSGDIPMTWVSDYRLYTASLVDGDVGLDATEFALQDVALVSGSLAVDPFVKVPGDIPYYGPDPGSEDDASVPELGLDQLKVTWSGTAADVVAVTAILVDNRGNTLERYTCAADGLAGQVGIPEDSWSSATVDSATEMIFGVSHILVTNTAIDGMDAVSRGIGTRANYAVYSVKK